VITAWRIVKRRHSESAFNGEGARLFGGRWNSIGTAVVYAAESRALALLELLAGLGSTSALDPYVLISVTFDEELVESLNLELLPQNWRTSPPPSDVQAIGDSWVAEGRSAILKVPSVVIPEEFNYVVNPLHPDFSSISIGEATTLHLDSRL